MSRNRPLADRDLEPVADAWVGCALVVAMTALPILVLLILAWRFLP